MSDKIVATYALSCPTSELAKAARAVAVEQTVEVPEGLITPAIEARAVGKVLEAAPGKDGAPHTARIAYDAALSGWELPRLLNLVYGNVSIQTGIRLVDLELPASYLSRFRGPNFGVAGLRRRLRVPRRPLLATALKPNGASTAEFEKLASDFARAGGDIIKDDQNLCDDGVAGFAARVRRVQAAVSEANAKTGGHTMYCPILCGPADELEGRVEAALNAGAEGLLVPPFLLGLDTVRLLAQRHRIVLLAHPSFTGTFFCDRSHGMTPGLLLGTLFRLAGCDVSIFPNPGGRFGFTQGECRELSQRLREPLGPLAPAFPAPAGGMTYARIPDMGRDYGPDTVFLVGGGLLEHSKSVYDGTRAFLDAIGELVF